MLHDRRNRTLASTALALVFAAPLIVYAATDFRRNAQAATAPNETAAAPAAEATTPAAPPQATPAPAPDLASRIPLPEPVDLPPPSTADLGGPTTGSVPAARASVPAKEPASSSPRVDSQVPAAAEVPPPSVKELALPTPPGGATPAAEPSPPAVAAPAPAGKELPALATELSEVDKPVAEKLRDLVTGKFDRLVDRKRERAAVEAFYTKRGFAPLWVANGKASERAEAAIARLKNADADGLDPHDYAVPDFAVASDQPDALAQTELKLTNVLLTFARHASGGRFNAGRVYREVEVAQPALEPADVLTKLADATDLAKTMDGFDPPHAGFQLLKAKLVEMRGRGNGEDSKRIADGPALKAGMQDARVPFLRERLGVAGDSASTAYDAKLAEAVKGFQQRNELRGTGILDAKTVEALNGPPAHRRVENIIATMERWRWLARDLGKAYVMINLPDYTLKVVRDGKTIFHTRIVIGKPAMATPIFSDEIENIVVNPTWHVPESIVLKEYLPALEQDPTVLERMGLVVKHEGNRVVIEQPPSERNALGRLKFNFPNRFNVYLHDTPDKNLFALDKRAFSHGCMRVLNPAAFGEVLLSVGLPDGHYSADRLTRMFGTGEQTLTFRTFIPVHITYQTAYVDDVGKLVVRDDVYGLDSRVFAAIKTSEYRVADVGQGTEAKREHAQSSAPSGGGRREARQTPMPRQSTGFGFFDRLFR
jgi:murein L,D-transpeptidase YcbB/YkuD